MQCLAQVLDSNHERRLFVRLLCSLLLQRHTAKTRGGASSSWNSKTAFKDKFRRRGLAPRKDRNKPSWAGHWFLLTCLSFALPRQRKKNYSQGPSPADQKKQTRQSRSQPSPCPLARLIRFVLGGKRRGARKGSCSVERHAIRLKYSFVFFHSLP